MVKGWRGRTLMAGIALAAIAELFRIEDGRIRRIEALMAGGLALDAASGWDE